MARSRFRRSPGADLPPLRLTPRDDAVLLDVLRLRYATAEHVWALRFPSYKTAADRLMRLFQHGYLDRVPLPSEKGQPPMVHVLGAAGARRLAELGEELPAEPRARARTALALGHELALTTVLVEFLKLAPPPGIRVSCVERASARLADRASDPAGAAPVRPDGAACVDAPGIPLRRFVLLEVDRGTMSPERMEAKFRAYRTWLTQGAGRAEAFLDRLRARHGLEPSDEPAGVKVGVVTDDPARSARLAAIAARIGCGRLFWMAEEAEMLFRGALGAVWTPAGELSGEGNSAVRRSLLD